MSTSRRAGYAAAMGTVLIGAGFILLSRFAAKTTLTPYDMLALRLVGALTVVLPLSRGMPPGAWRDRRLWLLTLSGGFGYCLFIYLGVKLAPAAHAAILLPGLQPFLVALVVLAFSGRRPARARWPGLALIGGGVACVGVPFFGGDFSAEVLAGDGLILVSSISWAIFAVQGRTWGFDPWVQTRFVALAATAVYLPVYLFWLPKGLDGVSATVLLTQGAFQGIASMILSMWLFLKAQSALGAEKVGALIALNPVIAGVAAVPLLGEPLTGWLLAGLLGVSLGAYLSVRPLPAPAAG